MDFLVPAWLRVFLAVVEHGSFNKAAEALFMSQPAVSQRIRQLEARLGVQLFHRTPQGVRLTPAGQIFLEYAQDTLRLLRAAERRMQKWQHQRQTLPLGSTPTVAAHRLPLWIHRFHRRHPHLFVSLHTDTTPNLVRRVAAHELPLAFIEGELPGETEVAYVLLQEIPYFAVAPRESPWRHRSSISVKELEGQPLVARPPETQTRKWMERLFREKGIQPVVVAEFDSPDAIKEAVLQGLGLALLPQCILEDDDRLHKMNITDLSFRRYLKAIWPRDAALSPEARAFLENLQLEFPHLRPLLATMT